MASTSIAVGKMEDNFVHKKGEEEAGGSAKCALKHQTRAVSHLE